MWTFLALLGGALAVPLSVPLSPLSPLIVYDPITYSGDEAEGWSWTTPKVEWEPPMLGDGAALNVSRSNARFAANFIGTGMFLNGSATANTTIIRMWDGKELTAQFEPYTFAGAYKVNLDADGHAFGKSMEHSWGLRLINGSFAVDQIIVQTQIDAAYTAGREAPELSQQPVLNNTKQNPMFNWEGEWDWVQQFDPGRFDDKQPHARGKPGAQVWWEIPEGAAYMAIAGFVGHRGGTYEVELSPSPGNTTKWSYNASRPFELITQMFITPLDPKTRYTAWLRNTDHNATLQFRSARYKFTNQDAADKFEALSAHLPQENKKKNVGAIVGGTIGGVVGVALIALAVFFVIRRRKVEEPTWEDTHLDLTEEPQVMVPYSQTVSPRDSRSQSDSGWRESLTSALSYDPKGRRIITPPRVQQESDAGTIIVPPSYDPAWAGSHSSAPGSPPPGGLPASPLSPNMSPRSRTSTDAKFSAPSSPDKSGMSSGADNVSQRLNEKAQYVAELSAAEEKQQPPNNGFKDEKKG